MIEERISKAKQSSDLTYRSVTRPTKNHDSDVLAALGAADAVILAATTAAGESGAVYVRDSIKRLGGHLAKLEGVDAHGIAYQVVSEIILDRCQYETDVARCVDGSLVTYGDWTGEPSGGWPKCHICDGSGRAKIDYGRRAMAAGSAKYTPKVRAAYDAAHNWVANRLINEGSDVFKLLR